MAIEFVGGRTAEWGGATTPNTATFGSGLSGGLSSTPSVDDFVVLWAGYSTTNLANPFSVTWGSGGSPTQTNGTTNDFVRSHTVLAYGFIDSTKLSNGTLSIALSGTAANASGTWIVKVYRGVDPTTPLDVALVNASTLNTSTANFAAITPVTSGAWIIAMAGGGVSSSASPYTSSLSNFFADQRDTFNLYRNHTGSGDFTTWSSGSYTPSSWGGGVSDAQHCSYSVTMALRPEPSGSSGDLAITEDADTLDGSVFVPTSGLLDVTEEADALVASGQVGFGVSGSLGDVAIDEGDDTLAATGTIAAAGDLTVTEDADVLAAIGLAGSNGPFVRRRMLILNQ
jgi:hypothetical protein